MQPKSSLEINGIEAHLNSFASRCFRDVADRDYISARMCYRAGLIAQFHWSALQAFEKYYKAILLYNRIVAKNVRHDLALARKLASSAPFEIELSDSSSKLLDHLDEYGQFRYLELSYFTHGPKLFELDRAVWEVRRYCRVLNHRVPIRGEDRSMLGLEIERNQRAAGRPPREFTIAGGMLERIVKNKKDPARAPLVWQNAFFGTSTRKGVRVPVHSYSENSPLYLYPEIIEHVREFVFVPKELAKAYGELAKRRAAGMED